MPISPFIALLSFCTVALTGCSKIEQPSSMYHHQSSMHLNNLQPSVIVPNLNPIGQTNQDKQARLPSLYQFRPVSPTREEVRRMSFADDQKKTKLELTVPIPRCLSPDEVGAIQTLLQLSQGGSD